MELKTARENIKKIEKKLEDLYKKDDREAKEAEKIKNSSPILNEVFKSANRVNQQNYRILILGAPGSGKTSFLNLLANIGNVNEARDPSFLTQVKAVNDATKENKVGVKMQS